MSAGTRASTSAGVWMICHIRFRCRRCTGRNWSCLADWGADGRGVSSSGRDRRRWSRRCCRTGRADPGRTASTVAHGAYLAVDPALPPCERVLGEFPPAIPFANSSVELGRPPATVPVRGRRGTTHTQPRNGCGCAMFGCRISGMNAARGQQAEPGHRFTEQVDAVLWASRALVGIAAARSPRSKTLSRCRTYGFW